MRYYIYWCCQTSTKETYVPILSPRSSFVLASCKTFRLLMLLGLINIRIDIIFIPKGSRLCCMSKIALLVDPVLFCRTIDLSGFIIRNREVWFYVSYGSSTNCNFIEMKIPRISGILDLAFVLYYLIAHVLELVNMSNKCCNNSLQKIQYHYSTKYWDGFHSNGITSSLTNLLKLY